MRRKEGGVVTWSSAVAGVGIVVVERAALSLVGAHVSRSWRAGAQLGVWFRIYGCFGHRIAIGVCLGPDNTRRPQWLETTGPRC